MSGEWIFATIVIILFVLWLLWKGFWWFIDQARVQEIIHKIFNR